MISKQWRIVLAIVAAFAVASVAFSGGLAVGLVIPQFTSGTDAAPIEISGPEVVERGDPSASQPSDLETLMEPFWETWDLLHEEYVDQPLDNRELVRGAIRGMVDSLGDPHTSYMTEDEFQQANFPLDGEYEGIGAWVDTDGEYLTIISAMPGSPAERAGLRPGDEVIAVDGEDMTGVDGNVVIRNVLGPAGTSVRLTIRREGNAEAFDVEIVREKITLPSVESEMLAGNVAYIRLYAFAADTSADLDRELRSLMRDDPVGLILDLRGNGGGFLNTAIDVTSQFIDEGVVLIERFGDGGETLYDAKPGGRATEIELVVLIDGGTASASEIVAGAIQDYGRGLLLGETSFGKGSVQNWVELSGDEGAVRVTIARWYTPNDRQIHGVGLTPDVEVIPSEDLVEGQDPQLDMAIEMILGETAFNSEK